MTLNDCKLAGYLGGTPELRFLPSGTPVVHLRLGQSYRYTDSHQKEHRKTNWFTVVAYGEVAQIAKAFEQGDNVVLEGNLETRDWQGQDGSRRRVTEVVARNIGRLERRPDREGMPIEKDSEGDPVLAALLNEAKEVSEDDDDAFWPV